MFALNCKNQILGAFLVAKGTLDEITLSITDIIKRTLLCNASRIIVAHNHPSGDVIPSIAMYEPLMFNVWNKFTGPFNNRK